MPDVRRLASLFVATLVAASPAIAATPDDIADQEALSHAHALEGAWHRLRTFILNESTSLTRWTASPPATPWENAWTTRGLSARYCDDILIVFAEPERLKGVGRNQRLVRLAPHLQSDEVPPPPPLHWLSGSTAIGGAGRADVALPSCMTGLPSGRVALAGEVEDPFSVVMTTLNRERETRPCPAGTHGAGRTFVRDVIQEVNGRGDTLGDSTHAPWQLTSDSCRQDTSVWVTFRLACTFDAGEPHNREITGEDIYRRQKTVTADGTSWGPPEFVSSSCWRDPTPLAPAADITVSTRTETRIAACTPPATGRRNQARTVYLRSTQFPWDDQPIVHVTGRDPWRTTSSTCRTPSTQNRSSSTGGRNGGREMGFDTDGDGVADYDSIHDVPDNLKDQAVSAPHPGTTEGHGGRRGGSRGGPGSGNDGNSGGNGCGCGGPGGGGPGDVG